MKKTTNIVQLKDTGPLLHPPPERTKIKITVVGEGIVGLSCAITEALQGHTVKVLANQSGEDSTSGKAAAFVLPVLSGRDPRINGMTKKSLEVLIFLKGNSASGVRDARLRVCYTEINEGDLDWLGAIETSPVPKEELPEGCICGYDALIFRMEMDIYLPFLRNWAEQLGVEFVRETVRDLTKLGGDVVINCTGIHAKKLIESSNLQPDVDLRPIRGQVELVSIPASLQAPWPKFDILIIEGKHPDGTPRLDYIVRRDKDLLLGGTQDIDDSRLTADEIQRKMILQNCIKVMPELRDAVFITDRVGLRPYRNLIRIAMESVSGGPMVVHAYGHGGSGVTLSWGTADLVNAMVSDIIYDLRSISHEFKPRRNAA
jgi:D-amino-acid oxidase